MRGKKILKHRRLKMSNNQKPKWKLIKEEKFDIKLPDLARFHLVITDKMFQRIAKFAKTDDGVAFYAGNIIKAGITILTKITQTTYDWKVFQHLKPEIEDENESEIIMTKHNSKTKLRKHKNHHMLIFIPYPIFHAIKNQHARINTFSMALLARIIIELFLDIYEKSGDYDKALAKMKDVILALCEDKNCEKCETKFKIYTEFNEDDPETRRSVVFFVVNLKSKKFGIDLYFELRL